MQKIWYIQIGGDREGPYSVFDLKRDRRITPDTLVWKDGFKTWKPIKKVRELKEVFSDEESCPTDELIKFPKPKVTPTEDELTLDWSREPPYLFWILAILIILFYVVWELYWR